MTVGGSNPNSQYIPSDWEERWQVERERWWRCAACFLFQTKKRNVQSGSCIWTQHFFYLSQSPPRIRTPITRKNRGKTSALSLQQAQASEIWTARNAPWAKLENQGKEWSRKPRVSPQRTTLTLRNLLFAGEYFCYDSNSTEYHCKLCVWHRDPR